MKKTKAILTLAAAVTTFNASAANDGESCQTIEQCQTENAAMVTKMDKMEKMSDYRSMGSLFSGMLMVTAAFGSWGLAKERLKQKQP